MDIYVDTAWMFVQEKKRTHIYIHFGLGSTLPHIPEGKIEFAVYF